MVALWPRGREMPDAAALGAARARIRGQLRHGQLLGALPAERPSGTLTTTTEVAGLAGTVLIAAGSLRALVDTRRRLAPVGTPRLSASRRTAEPRRHAWARLPV